MKLDDFLKIKKVRCIDTDNDKDLTIGKEYEVAGVDNDNTVKVIDDDCRYWYDTKLFEPVLDPVENQLQGAELTPEFEAVEPKFKAGDPVYCFGEKRISKINEYVGDETYSLRDSETLYQADYLTLATQENYERLQATFTDIEFEKSPEELTGSDLARALIKKGWVGFNCLCGNSGDKNAITETIVTGVNNSGQFTSIDGRLFNNAIPVIGCRPLEAREVGL